VVVVTHGQRLDGGVGDGGRGLVLGRWRLEQLLAGVGSDEVHGRLQQRRERLGGVGGIVGGRSWCTPSDWVLHTLAVHR
jgi:hypothetical protein